MGTHTAFLQAKVLQAKEVQSKIELKAEDAYYGKTSAQEARAKEAVKQIKQELSKTTDSGKMQTLASKLGPLNAKLFALTKKAKQLKTKVANRKQAAVALSLQVDSEKKDLRGKLASLEKTRETAKEKKQSVLRQEEKGKSKLEKAMKAAADKQEVIDSLKAQLQDGIKKSFNKERQAKEKAQKDAVAVHQARENKSKVPERQRKLVEAAQESDKKLKREASIQKDKSIKTKRTKNIESG